MSGAKLLVAFLAMLSLSGTSQSAHNQAVVSNDEQLLDSVQRQCMEYFWSGAESVSGLAPERIHLDGVYNMDDQDVIASGGSGFGIMAILVGVKRNFIEREEAVSHLERAMDFLEKSERFHGAWPHWIYNTGKAKPFSAKDDGGDIVETSYLAQGLLCARQFFKDGNARERELAKRMDSLWRGIEWNWYRGSEKENVLFWHWSPRHGWDMAFRIQGYNECLITYVLAASSPTYPVPPEVYHEGWAVNGEITDGPTQYGRTLAFKHQGAPEFGGPLFWAHYSFLGLDPRKLKDQYADYWEHNVNHVMIDYEYCLENPKNYSGYGENCWGLTASYTPTGYSGHKPERDLGVISPTAALSSFPYSPIQSMAVLKHFYNELGDRLIGDYGPYDAFSEQVDWFPRRYLAIDQGPIVTMIENYRSGFMWDLFMSCEEVQNGLTKLGFTY